MTLRWTATPHACRVFVATQLESIWNHLFFFLSSQKLDESRQPKAKWPELRIACQCRPLVGAWQRWWLPLTHIPRTPALSIVTKAMWDVVRDVNTVADADTYSYSSNSDTASELRDAALEQAKSASPPDDDRPRRPYRWRHRPCTKGAESSLQNEGDACFVLRTNDKSLVDGSESEDENVLAWGGQVAMSGVQIACGEAGDDG